MANEKIEDQGEFLPYAAKHRARDSTGSKSQLRLKDIWPEPNWKELISDGLDPFVAARLALTYRGLRTKPRNGIWSQIRADDWESGFRDAAVRLKAIFQVVRTKKQALELNDLLAKSFGYSNANTLAKAPLEETYPFWAIGRGERRFSAPATLTKKSRYLARCLPELYWPESNAAITLGKFPLELKSLNWVVAWAEGKSVYFSLEEYATREEVICEILKQLEKPKPKHTPIPTKPSVVNVEREGVDQRQDDVSGEELMAAFGLRAIQFGNSLSNKEKQMWINNTFDALADLADVLNFPRKWIGMKGLAIAFGARGQGGSLAHYEPDLRAINQTRKKGAGSLSHEWFHGFDHRISTSISSDMDFSLYASGFRFHGGSKIKDSKFSRVREVYRILCYAHGREVGGDYFKRSARVNGLNRSGGYWTKPHELMARSFESFVQDKLLEMGRVSPWLVHGTKKEDYKKPDNEHFPYPLSEERESISKAYSALFDEIKRL